MPTVTDTPETRSKISDLSRLTEEVLLLLLTGQAELGRRLDAEEAARTNDVKEIREGVDRQNGELRQRLEKECEDRKGDVDKLQGSLNEQASKGDQETQNLRDLLQKEKEERIQGDNGINDYYGSENEARKQGLADVNEWIRAENEKRRLEAEALQARMEKEKEELRNYIEKDNEAMKSRMSEEEESRRRKEEELKKQLTAQQEAGAARENEIIELYKRLADQNREREREIRELQQGMQQEKEEMRAKLERENAELRSRLERENAELKAALEKERRGLKDNIDGNLHEANRKSNEMAAKIGKMIKDSESGLKELNVRLEKEGKELRKQMSLPLSVYFDAYRTEDYVAGGEEYLTFSGCITNMGRGMNPGSGVFTAPLAGSYLFIVHVCTHDMRKALLALRRNGTQLASFYDQNHESNHKNSMAGQSVVVDLNQGDKVQVYLYTDTGLQDKQSNHLTHFVGLFLRPKDFLSDVMFESRMNQQQRSGNAITNGH